MTARLTSSLPPAATARRGTAWIGILSFVWGVAGGIRQRYRVYGGRGDLPA